MQVDNCYLGKSVKSIKHDMLHYASHKNLAD